MTPTQKPRIKRDYSQTMRRMQWCSAVAVAHLVFVTRRLSHITHEFGICVFIWSYAISKLLELEMKFEIDDVEIEAKSKAPHATNMMKALEKVQE